MATHVLQDGQVLRAQQLAEQALAIQEATLGQHDPRLITTLQALGGAANQRGESEAALEYYTRAFELRQRADPDSPDLALEESNLAIAAVEAADFATARSLVESAIPRLEATYGPQSAYLVNALVLRGYVARERPDPDLDASLRDMLRAREIAIATNGERAPETLNTEIELANTWMARGEHHRAVRLIEPHVNEIEKLALPSKVAGELRLTLAQALTPTGPHRRMCDLAAQAEIDLREAEVLPLSAAATAWRSKHCR